MIHKIFSAIGLGILGIDPITAVYLLSMGLCREKKIKISLFFLSFAGFSIFIGAALAVLMGGESNSILSAAILLTVWFLVSQCFATIVYIANQCNLLNKLVNHMDKVKHKNLKAVKYLFYFVLIVIAILLIADTGFYLFNGRYLF